MPNRHISTPSTLYTSSRHPNSTHQHSIPIPHISTPSQLHTSSRHPHSTHQHAIPTPHISTPKQQTWGSNPRILPGILPSETRLRPRLSPSRGVVRKELASYPASHTRSPWCLILSLSLLLDIQYILVSLMLDSHVRVGFCCIDAHRCAVLALPSGRCF